MSENDMEQAPRRRSARIVALEEKREREKKARKEAQKNCPGNKGKGKAVINEFDDDFIYDDDDDDDEEGDGGYVPRKRRARKSRPLSQLISLTQPIHAGQYTQQHSSGSRYGLPGVLPKETLGFALDMIQRQDPDKLFAQPINPARDYHKTVKEPMDLSIMRAKVHENMYTSMEQFEAEAVKNEPSNVFHASSADPKFFNSSYFGLDQKKSGGRKHHSRQSRNPVLLRQLPSTSYGGNSGVNNSMEAEVDKRQTYCPSGDSMFSQALNGNKSSFQLNMSCFDYQDSLVRYVGGMGPIVKKYAAMKIESLRNSLFVLGEPTQPNPLANFLDTTQPTSMMSLSLPPPPPPPQEAARGGGHDAPRGNSMRYPIISGRPLSIPGITIQDPPQQETRNMDRSGDYKGKKVMVDSKESWNAHAASILSDYFMNNKGRESGLKINGEDSSSNSNMASISHPDKSPYLNIFSSSKAANQNKNQLMQWNDNPEPSNGRNNVVNTPGYTSKDETPRVWPSIVVSGSRAQAQQRPNAEPISNSGKQHVILRPEARRPSVKPLLSENNNFTYNNMSQQSLSSQNMKEFDFSPLRQALWASSQQNPSTEQVTEDNSTWQSSMFHNNLSWWQSYMSQQVSQEAMNMTKPSYNNLSGHESLLSHQQSRSSNSSSPMVNGYNYNTLSGLGQSSFLSQQRPEDVGSNVTGWQSNVPHPQPDYTTLQSFLPKQKPESYSLMVAQAMAGHDNDDDNVSQVSKWAEERTSDNLYNMGNNLSHTDDFQTLWAPIDLNNAPFSEHAGIYSAPPHPHAMFDRSDNFLMQPKPRTDPAQQNPLGPLSGQVPSSAPLEMSMGHNAINYYVGNELVGQSIAGGGGGSTYSAQLQWDNDRQPNLSLQL